MERLALMPKYDDYVDSGVEWLGRVPASWELTRLGTRFNERRSKVSDIDYPALSVTKKGVLPQLDNAAKTKDGDNRKLVKEGDFVINSRSDRKGSSGVSDRDGSVSLINIVLKPKGIHPKFSEHLLKSHAFIEEYYRVGRGIVADLWTTRYDEMRTIAISVPSLEEQTRIANFLDKKTAQIDEAIAIKEQQISLLKERKQIIIQQAVTQGLDSNVPMKDSGVDWIGKIPAHWEVRRSKFVFTQRKERAWKDDVQLSATQAYGVIPQDQYEELTGKRVVKIQLHLDKRKHVERDDFVISMRSFQGGLERAWSQGCIRSSYVVLRALDEIDPSFYGYLLKLPSYIAALQQTASFIRDGQDLNFDNFSKVDLFIPPIEEQKEIANYVSAFMKSSDEGIELLLAQIEKLKEYKTSLINSAVTGKIKITPEMVEQ
ncbi:MULTISPECIES: restriction endonuclease subunit S [Vibrio]|uniref:restriction endonuclease subunit S n=1 Tax=Vibrio TaxID=662 RepID=UPI0023EBEB90|nr:MULTISPECIES: restriction endonuclease subunit S [unclassified Vibrio]MDF5473347.1 restriction endonuclease subunit S [Vibrio parahaemolyticus]MDW2077129.1 restriction endonuclease subunit S [Vibrio sp. 1863]MDW2094421.1 restriction endonuclease subunit S [Vibrio sp. 1866]MDW2274181.1 restriction endonuclease subunit S [Vibrio sp. 1074]MDW2287528.1 restriction endonuclease subunit S [Vibrio sp. 1562]